MEKGTMTETQVRQLLLEQYGFHPEQLEQLAIYLQQLATYNRCFREHTDEDILKLYYGIIEIMYDLRLEP